MKYDNWDGLNAIAVQKSWENRSDAEREMVLGWERSTKLYLIEAIVAVVVAALWFIPKLHTYPGWIPSAVLALTAWFAWNAYDYRAQARKSRNTTIKYYIGTLLYPLPRNAGNLLRLRDEADKLEVGHMFTSSGSHVWVNVLGAEGWASLSDDPGDWWDRGLAIAEAANKKHVDAKAEEAAAVERRRLAALV